MRTISLSDIKSLDSAIYDATSLTSWKKYDCKLLTPMYGGGVKAGEVDKNMPIRASSIRGQLRFWWRVAFGQNVNSKKVFEKEKSIWGGINASGSTKSQVDVRVAFGSEQPKLVPSKEYGNTGIKYAFGCSGIGNETEWLKEGSEFSLYLRYPEKNDLEIQKTLRLWASFGGIGGRTRRGFGAIEIKPDNGSLKPFSQEEFEGLGGQLAFPNVENQQSAISAWEKAVTKLYEFRQKPGTGRRQKNGGNTKRKEGCSFWPEPDAIRRFTGITGGLHKPVHLAGNVFPRAAFGLPITFRFIPSKSVPEPSIHTLLPTGHERMASPLILRPYWDGKAWQAMALLLPNAQKALQQDLTFKEGVSKKCVPNQWPSNTKEQQILANDIPPMKNRGNDPLSAFMAYFRERES